MKLSELDFRPPPPKKKGGWGKWMIGMAVGVVLIWGVIFFFWEGRAHLLSFFQKEEKKIAVKSTGSISPKRNECGLNWSSDSLVVELLCQKYHEVDCMDCLEWIHPELSYGVNNILVHIKALNHEVDYQEIKFQFKLIGEGVTMSQLVLLNERKHLVYTLPEQGLKINIKEKKVEGDWCGRNCEEKEPFEWPLIGKASIIPYQKGDSLIEYHEWPVPTWSFTLDTNAPVFPLRKGKVVEIQQSDALGQVVKLYHGRGLYSYYGNMGRVQKEIRLGSQVTLKDTLGFMALLEDDESKKLKIRVEKNGIFLFNFNNLSKELNSK